MFSSSKGAGFQAQGASPEQLNTAYAQTQAGIKQQQDFVNALNAQNGLANQTSVFGQQQGLANQLQGVANGTGPNPALAQLNQTTGANIASQAALMAGQRGSAANTGMIARQAAQQGGNLQQQAVGQGATLGAQQQLAGMQQLQSQQSNMANMANTQIGQQQAGISALNQNQLQQQANLMGLQASANAANASIAKGNQGAQGNMLGNMMGGIGGAVGGLFGGGGSGSTGGGDIVGNQDPTQAIGGDFGSSGGGFIGDGATALAKGGEVHKYAEGGPAFDPLMDAQAPAQVTAPPPPVQQDTTGPQSNVGKMFNDQSDVKDDNSPSKGGGAGGMMQGMGQMGGAAMKGLESWGEHEALPWLQDFFGGLLGTTASIATTTGPEMAGGAGDAIVTTAPAVGAGAAEVAPAVAVAAKGGRVPALVSPGELYLSPDKVNAVNKGANPRKIAEKIPGKPKVGGAKNSYANDTVKATLQEGGIVIPRSVTQSKDAEKKSIAFVRAVMARNGHMPKKAK